MSAQPHDPGAGAAPADPAAGVDPPAAGAPAKAGPPRILILGGTTEARVLAERLADRDDCTAILSLAGRTASPAAQAVPTRTGGFGGIDGLIAYLRDEHIGLLVDATHPFAAQISVHATAAAHRTGVHFIAIRRPPWRAVAGDRWTEVDAVDQAVDALQGRSRRVFLALGRQELAPFERMPQHAYLIRSVDPVEPPLAVPDAAYVTDRGPFEEAKERALLEGHRIEVVVAKNSGGDATYGKIAAARALGLDVVMVRRPPAPPGTVSTVEAALEAIVHHLASRKAGEAAAERGE